MAKELQPGDMIAGRYRVDKKLGQGGMGAIYRATQTGLLRGVAVKVLKPSGDDGPKVRQRFEREAHVLAALRHPGAVQIYDFGEFDGQLFIVMELLLGESLEDRLARTSLSDSQKLGFMRDVADVLVATHEIDLVHRDIKPDNIFIEDAEDNSERAKLVDFGLAFIAQQGELGRVTRDGLVSGTPQYVSPEQAMDKVLTPASDIYSLGVVFFRLLTGSLPFTGSLGELVSSHIYATPPRLRSLVKNTPSALEDLVMEMLAKAPKDRPSASLVRQTIESIQRGTAVERATTIVPRDGRVLIPPNASENETIDIPITDVLHADFKTGERVGREARQLETPQAGAKPTRRFSERVNLGVVGPLPETVRVSLATRAIDVRAVGSIVPKEVDALLVLGSSLEDISKMQAHSLPLIADASADDFERVTALLKIGVSDVVTTPLEAEPVARKVERALRRLERKRS